MSTDLTHTHIEYYENGRTLVSVPYQNKKLHGKYIMYYKMDKLMKKLISRMDWRMVFIKVIIMMEIFARKHNTGMERRMVFQSNILIIVTNVLNNSTEMANFLEQQNIISTKEHLLKKRPMLQSLARFINIIKSSILWIKKKIDFIG